MNASDGQEKGNWHLPLLACNPHPIFGYICSFREAMWRILGEDLVWKMAVFECTHLSLATFFPMK